MTNSILISTKKILGIAADYTEFDLDVITHINSAFNTLHDLGVGPVEGFAIEDAVAEWGDFLGGDVRLNRVRSYIYLRTRLLFDPPTTSFAITALENQAKEMEWRLNAVTEPIRPYENHPLAL